MLKLMSMNLYDMEGNSRMENLVAFKRTYAGAIHALAGCLEKFFPRMSEDEVRRLIYTLLPFLFGIYPYTSPTEKQRRAMELAGISAPALTVYEMTRSLTQTLLQGSK